MMKYASKEEDVKPKNRIIPISTSLSSSRHKILNSVNNPNIAEAKSNSMLVLRNEVFSRPHSIIRKKTAKYEVAATRVAEEVRRAVRVAERNTEVVFRIVICSLDLLFLLHQGKRKEISRISLPNEM